jgi:hypothetical protein
MARRRTWMSGRCVAAAAVLTGLIGTTDLRAEPIMAPVYAVGDKLTWQDGDRTWTEEVVAIEGDVVTWLSSNGDRVEGSTNFLMPARQFDEVEHGIGAYEVVEMVGEAFPLEAGKRVTIRYRRIDAPEDGLLSRSCTVFEPERVTVPAGTFEAVRINCQQLNRTKTWYYAPEIGSLVRYLNVHRWDGRNDHRLVAIERAEETP